MYNNNVRCKMDLKVLLDLFLTSIDLVEEGANSEAFIKIIKGRNVRMDLEKLLAGLTPEQASVIAGILKSANSKDAIIADLQAKIDTLTEEVNKSKADKTKGDINVEALDPAVKAYIETINKQKKLAEEAYAEALAEKAKIERVEKAKKISNLGTVEELSNVIDGMSDAQFALLEKANEVIAKSKMFDEVGTDAEGNSTTTSKEAWEKIEKAAQELQKATPTLTKEAAISEVVKLRKDLYTAYVKTLGV